MRVKHFLSMLEALWLLPFAFRGVSLVAERQTLYVVAMIHQYRHPDYPAGGSD